MIPGRHGFHHRFDSTTRKRDKTQTKEETPKIPKESSVAIRQDATAGGLV